MSPRRSSSTAGGPYRKPRADLYTVLLAIALVALLLGILCLYLLMKEYQFKYKGGPTVPPLPQAAAAPETQGLGPLAAAPARQYGKLTFFRIYSGTLQKGSQVLNATTGKKERLGRLLLLAPRAASQERQLPMRVEDT